MRLEAKKFFYDIGQAAQMVASFTAGNTLTDYQADPMLRSDVERQFEVIGEALTRLARLDRSLAARITEFERIVAFRNIVSHGYAQIDDRIGWDIVQSKLPILRQEVARTLKGE